MERSYGVIPVLKKEGEEGFWFLLVRHHAGHWAFPKGHPADGESPVETALRELAEETGIRECRLYEHKGFTERYDVLKGGKTGPKTVTYFMGRVADPAVRVQPEEIADFRWLKFDDALELATFEECKNLLRQSHAWLKGHSRESRNPL